MPLLVFRPDEHEFEFPHDVQRIVDLCAEAGFEISANDAARAWRRYSENQAASWLAVCNDAQEVLQVMQRYCTVQG